MNIKENFIVKMDCDFLNGSVNSGDTLYNCNMIENINGQKEVVFFIGENKDKLNKISFNMFKKIT